MQRLEVVKHSGSRSTIQDLRGNLVFTVVTKGSMAKSMTRASIYRGHEGHNSMVAVLQGKKATFYPLGGPQEDLTHYDTLNSNSTSSSYRVFETWAGNLKWKTSGFLEQMEYRLVRGSQINRSWLPLLTISKPLRQDKAAFHARGNAPVQPQGCLGAACFSKGPNLNWHWTLSAEAVDSRAPFCLLADGRGTEVLERAIIALIMIAKDEEDRSAACAVGACPAVPMVIFHASHSGGGGGMGGGM